MGEKSRTDSAGETAKGWDHDPPAKEKLAPLGILTLATGALSLVFGSKETSDFWADAIQLWWSNVRGDLSHIKRLVVYLDKRPRLPASPEFR